MAYPDAGLELARLADLPQDVMIESKRVANHLAGLYAKDKAQSASNQTSLRRKALLRVGLFFSIFLLPC